jgi:hypothetical protein
VTSAGKIISFDKFGIKENITLYPGSNPDIRFYEDEILFNPEEITKSYYAFLPPGFESVSYNANVFLSIPSYHKSSDLSLLTSEGQINNPVIIPVLPGNDFKIKIHNEYINTLGYDEHYPGKQWKYLSLKDPLEITLKQSFYLTLPQDEFQYVTDTTTFEISDNSPPALYQFSLFCEDKAVRLFTNKQRVIFRDFKTRGFELYPNKVYFWHVRKFPGYNNIDQFLSQPFTVDDRYEYIELSRNRMFKTVP